MNDSLKNINIGTSFIDSLPADIEKNNFVRQVKDACYSWVNPTPPSSPKLVAYSLELARMLGMTEDFCCSEEFLHIFSGYKVLEHTQPYASCYGGHQFGSWSGQLGDGRAIHLFEIVQQDKRWTLQLKGAGKTPYSRRGDGLAVLRSSLREFLCSEAMYYLGIPTTRALCLIKTGDKVIRDMLYDGHPQLEPGAIVCRVAPTFIRFGHFEILAARKDIQNLKRLADYTITHFFSHINMGDKDAYVDFFREVFLRSISLVVHWQRVGFVHGVLNTDNMSILGETIDYGPYGWLDIYQKNWTPNFTDFQSKRYTFGQQAHIVHWNLVQLANALYPLVNDPKPFTDILESFNTLYTEQYLQMMRQKLGLEKSLDEDKLLIERLEHWMEKMPTDFTIFFRMLSHSSIHDQEEHILEKIQVCFYEQLLNPDEQVVLSWMKDYIARLKKEEVHNSEAMSKHRQERMNLINPKYIFRNHLAQIAIEHTEQGNDQTLHDIHQFIKHPYAEQAHLSERYFQKQPAWAREKIGSAVLSCSS